MTRSVLAPCVALLFLEGSNSYYWWIH
jgi:hypothetical protein